MRLVLLCFPALLLYACATAVPVADPPQLRTVVTLGDSVPAGTACGCDPFPELYARAQHATDVNLAEPGSTATDVRVAVPGNRDVLSTAAEVVIMTGARLYYAMATDGLLFERVRRLHPRYQTPVFAL